MALSIECSGVDLFKYLKALKSQPENETSQRHRVELLLSIIHFQVMKKQMLEPSSPDFQSQSGSSYIGVCASSTRARAHGHPEGSFWYGSEGKSINFPAVMRPSRALSRNATAPEMIAIMCGLHAKQRHLHKEDHFAYTLATDGDIFRFFRMNEEGQPTETQCRSGNGYEDAILLLVAVFNNALVPPGARTISPAAHEDITGKTTHSDLQVGDGSPLPNLSKVPSHTRRGNHPRTYEPDTDKDHKEEEYHKDHSRMQKMAVRVGVNVYMNVLQELPIPLSRLAERKTLGLIQQVIFEAIGSPFEEIHYGDCEKGFPHYGAVFMRNFDIELKKVLEEVDFEDYNDNQKVLKRAIRMAVLEEISPVFEEILLEVRDQKVERFFK
ncbi:hypothetical protein PEX1_074880 [Penicillium expansum]|uniref:Uncharacterized protein n=1 Tax=Penicillium expansum TaxID=27334 RepID=A0A0A2J356_PENEN|nr:hypothetical protein PEX2_103870 [Penicillium expansum]KGO37895.1 hypothetical protein PEXP_079110 [Penicillium expansum]KGO49754.1 hypothetical protein PEX2_103870 [Penicillium expansum]KGO73651.1 hypothetical protein PEX1_074880 [Penicillium expansum]